MLVASATRNISAVASNKVSDSRLQSIKVRQIEWIDAL